MTTDVLPAELMKEAKRIHYCEDCYKELLPEDYAYHSANHSTIAKEWLPVSAVTKWQQELNVKIVKLMDIGSLCVGCAKANGLDKKKEWKAAIEEVLGVKP